MYTLSQVLQGTALHLGNQAYHRGIATGGSVSTLVDTTNSDSQDDESRFGTLIIQRVDGLGAAPEGQFAQITGYNSSSQTYTFGANLTTSVAAGMEYIVIMPQYPFLELRRLVNHTLDHLGPIGMVDTSLITIANQTEYVLPTAIGLNTPLQVRIQTYSTTGDRWFVEFHAWHIAPSSIGVGVSLVFEEIPYTGMAIQIFYEGFHPELYAYNDQLSSTVPSPLIETWVASSALEWYGVSAENQMLYSQIQNDLKEWKAKYLPLWKPRRSGKLLTWLRYNNRYPDNRYIADQYGYPGDRTAISNNDTGY